LPTDADNGRIFATPFTTSAATAFGHPLTRISRNPTSAIEHATPSFRRISFSSPTTPASRDQARHLLIAKYFPPSEQIALYELIGLPIPSEIEIEQNAAYKSAADAMQVGREARFRIRILAAYDYTCALTGYRLATIRGTSIVDAAHIHQFADSRNNELGNGMALCKNAHWLFDKGLWTISDDFRVVVAASRFTESGKPDLLLGNYQGNCLRLPDDRSLWPSPIHLAWHRRQKFDRD
jgi:putative restriction endonuclease